MSKEELEKKMREVLTKAGKSQSEIDSVVSVILVQPYMQTDNTRQIFFEQWGHTDFIGKGVDRG